MTYNVDTVIAGYILLHASIMTKKIAKCMERFQIRRESADRMY